MLVNDWTLRNLTGAELAKGFGFYQSKPAPAFRRSPSRPMNWALRGMAASCSGRW